LRSVAAFAALAAAATAAAVTAAAATTSAIAAAAAAFAVTATKTAATTAAASAAEAAAATTAAAAALTALFGFADAEFATRDFKTVQRPDGLLSRFAVTEGHKRKSPGTAAFTVKWVIKIHEGFKWGEGIAQFSFGRVVGHVSDV
jgi:hypothetical protein